MARTLITGNQVSDGTVVRADLNVTTAGDAVIRKVIAGSNVSFTSTGVDSGTGDVTINANLVPAAPQAVVYATTINLDCTTVSTFYVALDGNATVNLINATDGQRINIRFTQGTGGNKLVTFGAMVRYGTDIPSITLSTAQGKQDYIGFIYNSGASKYDLVSYVRGF